jgi:hypothetical protein
MSMNTTSVAAINATEASKKVVAVCANSGRPFYIGATVDELTKEHQDICGNRQEFVESAYEPDREKTDFTVYEVPTSVAEEIDGDSRIDFASEFGKGISYRLIAAIKDDEQNSSALADAVAKARTVAQGYADGDEDGDHYSGLSVNRTVDAYGEVFWDISFAEDLSKTIVYCSADFDFRTKTDEEITEIITDCWEAEWDHHDDR